MESIHSGHLLEFICTVLWSTPGRLKPNNTKRTWDKNSLKLSVAIPLETMYGGYCRVCLVSSSHCLTAVFFMSHALFCVLINYFVLFIYLFYVCFLVLNVLPSILFVLCFCIVLYIVSPYVYSCLFSIWVQFTDHCQLVETQLQFVNISYTTDIPACCTSLQHCIYFHIGHVKYLRH